MLIGQQQPGTWNIDELLFSNWRKLFAILFRSVCSCSSITKDREGKVVLNRVMTDLPDCYEKNIKSTTINKYLKTSLTTIYT